MDTPRQTNTALWEQPFSSSAALPMHIGEPVPCGALACRPVGLVLSAHACSRAVPRRACNSALDSSNGLMPTHLLQRCQSRHHAREAAGQLVAFQVQSPVVCAHPEHPRAAAFVRRCALQLANRAPARGCTSRSTPWSTLASGVAAGAALVTSVPQKQRPTPSHTHAQAHCYVGATNPRQRWLAHAHSRNRAPQCRRVPGC
jgi:hypothetical protein